MFTQNGAQMEISNEVKTKILKAQQALRSVSDANVYLYSSDDDYVAGVRSESDADGFDEQGARNSNASYVRDGNIHINITKMNQQSLSHEIFHAALVGIAKKNPDAFIAMRKQIMGRIRPDATLNVVNKKQAKDLRCLAQNICNNFLRDTLMRKAFLKMYALRSIYLS